MVWASPILILAGIFLGFAYRVPGIRRWENETALLINRYPLPDWMDTAFQALRYLGTKWVFWPALAACALYVGQGGWLLVFMGVLAVLLERAVKLSIGRQRPFRLNPAIQVRQSPSPTDPSFPSGDAVRVWFLVCGVGRLGWAPPAVYWFVLVLASVVSVGRIRLGVHYPLDVWTGSLIGILAIEIWEILGGFVL